MAFPMVCPKYVKLHVHCGRLVLGKQHRSGSSQNRTAYWLGRHLAGYDQHTCKTERSDVQAGVSLLLSNYVRLLLRTVCRMIGRVVCQWLKPHGKCSGSHVYARPPTRNHAPQLCFYQSRRATNSLIRYRFRAKSLRSDQISLHLFQPHQADQMFDPHLVGSPQQAYYDISDIISILVSGAKLL